MLNFAALPTEDTMSIGNQILHFNVKAALPPEHENVDTIAWTGKDGIIERNDRLRLLEPFLDLAPYIELVRAWLWAAEEQLSLAQAKLVMKDFIDALYISKRQLPYNGYTAKDDDIFYNTARLVAGGSSGIVPEINNRIDGINSRFGSACYWLNLRPQADTFRSIYLGRVGMGAGTPNDVNPGQGFYGANTGTNAMWFYSAEAYSAAHGWRAFVRDASPQYTAVAIDNLAHISGGTGDTVPWETDTGQINTLAYDTANTLLRNILNRSQTLLTTKANKINAMLALTTLPAVIAFDVTGGW